MKRVLITGLSGTGKSAVVRSLAALGYRAIDADEELSELVEVAADEVTGVGGGMDWVWRADRVEAVLDEEPARDLFIGGTSPNQGRFYPRFDHVVLLTAPASTMAERLRTRDTNDFGKDPGELERSLRFKETIEPLLRRGADLVIDTTIALDDVVDAILRHVRGSGA